MLGVGELSIDPRRILRSGDTSSVCPHRQFHVQAHQHWCVCACPTRSPVLNVCLLCVCVCLDRDGWHAPVRGVVSKSGEPD